MQTASVNPLIASAPRNLGPSSVAAFAWQNLSPDAIALFDTVPTPIFVKDTGGVFLYINNAGAQSLGCQPHELIGRCGADVLPPDLASKLLSHDRLAILGGQPYHSRERIFDGHCERAMRCTLIPLRDETGQIYGLFGTAQEISNSDVEAPLWERNGVAQGDIERLNEILGVGDTAFSQQNSPQFLDGLLERLRIALRAETATLWLLDESGKYLRAEANRGQNADFSADHRIAVGQGLIGEVASRREAIAVDDVSLHASGNLFLPEQTRSLAAAALTMNGDLIGVFQIGSVSPGVFDAQTLRLLQLVSDRAVVAIERFRLFAEVRSGRQQLDVLSRRLLEVQENERHHIARELHDEVGQVLTAVKICLQRVSLAPDKIPPALAVEEAITAVEESIEMVRDMSRNLRPLVLDDLGLVPALHWFANRQTRSGVFECLVDAPQFVKRLPADLEIACFRIVQEAVNNAARYASATIVNIRLRVRNGVLHLEVQDNGIGFDVVEVQHRSLAGDSLGLLNMDERARLIGGQFVIKSKIGVGTKIRALFTLPSNGSHFIPDARKEEIFE